LFGLRDILNDYLLRLRQDDFERPSAGSPKAGQKLFDEQAVGQAFITEFGISIIDRREKPYRPLYGRAS
jgi:hypothetical protein